MYLHDRKSNDGCQRMKSLALPVGECKMICNKALAERRCLLTQPWQNRAQYICAGGVLCAPYLIRHKAMRVHLESVCVCVCIGCSAPCLHLQAAIQRANMPQIHLNRARSKCASLSGEILGFDSCVQLKGERSEPVCVPVWVSVRMRTLKDICAEECRRQGIVVRERCCQGDHHPGLKTGLEDLPL